MKLYMPEMRAELPSMETLAELCLMRKRIEARWISGKMGSPQEIVRLDRERRELERKIQALTS
jgi:hypothetical protein